MVTSPIKLTIIKRNEYNINAMDMLNSILEENEVFRALFGWGEGRTLKNKTKQKTHHLQITS